LLKEFKMELKNTLILLFGIVFIVGVVTLILKKRPREQPPGEEVLFKKFIASF